MKVHAHRLCMRLGICTAFGAWLQQRIASLIPRLVRRSPLILCERRVTTAHCVGRHAELHYHDRHACLFHALRSAGALRNARPLRIVSVHACLIVGVANAKMPINNLVPPAALAASKHYQPARKSELESGGSAQAAKGKTKGRPRQNGVAEDKPRWVGASAIQNVMIQNNSNMANAVWDVASWLALPHRISAHCHSIGVKALSARASGGLLSFSVAA